MKMVLFIPVFILFYLSENIVLAVQLPPGIEFCHKSDSNFNHCLETQMTKALKILKDGVSELGIPRLEPFVIPKIEIVAQSSESISLNQKYTNSLTYGISGSEAYDAKFVLTDKECYWDFMVLTPDFRVETDYEFSGRLLVFPVNTHGKGIMNLPNVRVHHQAQCELYKKNGKSYIRNTNYQMDIKTEQVQLEFDNLIPGNKQLSDSISIAVKENSVELFNELKHGFETVWSQLHLQTFNNVLGKIPVDELFPE